MKIALLSCPGRSDIVGFWQVCLERFWPGCPWPIDVLKADPEPGWTKRMLLSFQSIGDEFVMLWLDDQFLSSDVPAAEPPKLLSFIRANRDVAAIHLSRVPTPEGDERLPGYREYLHQEPLYHMTQIAPSIWRRDVLVAICVAVLEAIMPEEDAGWTGAYNWELYAPKMLGAWVVLAPERRRDAPLKVLNGVAQNLWTEQAISLARALGATLNVQRGQYTKGQDPYMDSWREARRSANRARERQRQLERLAREEAKKDEERGV